MQPDLFFQTLSDSGVTLEWVYWLRHDLNKTPFYHHIAIAVRLLTADTRSMLYFYSHFDTSLSMP